MGQRGNSILEPLLESVCTGLLPLCQMWRARAKSASPQNVPGLQGVRSLVVGHGRQARSALARPSKAAFETANAVNTLKR